MMIYLSQKITTSQFLDGYRYHLYISDAPHYYAIYTTQKQFYDSEYENKLLYQVIITSIPSFLLPCVCIITIDNTEAKRESKIQPYV